MVKRADFFVGRAKSSSFLVAAPTAINVLAVRANQDTHAALLGGIPYVLNITATPPARNQSALAAKLGN